ncbi:LysE family transporter [Jonesiaceae bacterium BS-20]|uniref:LysE family transporter n=1 Tax=Jonesiaceae bacterium BS-20 TaxID=3120821 RepID=A0AAU7E0V3_9MICO
MGIASGLLNPKNALFYLSLAAALTYAPPQTLVAYGTWMFAIVLTWDLFIAFMFGSKRTLTRLERLIPLLTKISGGFLMIFGVSMIAAIG